MKTIIYLWICLLLIIVSALGCAKAKYAGLEYERFGNQQIDGFYLKRTDPNGVSFEAGFTNQQSLNDEFAKKITDGIVTGLTPLLVP